MKSQINDPFYKTKAMFNELEDLRKLEDSLSDIYGNKFLTDDEDKQIRGITHRLRMKISAMVANLTGEYQSLKSEGII